MRCIREGTRAECNRCLAAGARCTFSVARKAGRPPGSAGGSTTSMGKLEANRRGRDREREMERGRESEQEKGDHGWRGERQKEEERESAYPQYSVDLTNDFDFSSDLPSDLSIFEASGSLLEDETSSSLFITGASNSLAIPSNPDTHHNAWAESESHQYPGLNVDTGTTHENNRFVTPPPLFETQFLVEDTSNTYSTVGSSTQQEQPTNSFERQRVETEHINTNISTNTMQQLSELSGKLFAHISSPCIYSRPRTRPYVSRGSTTIDRIDMGNDTNMNMDRRREMDTDPQITRLGQLTSHVIESSVTFHRILSNPLGPVSFDTAATLLILTAYIRLAQLHLALYNHIRSILQTNDPPPSAAYPSPGSSNPSPSSGHPRQFIPIAFPSLNIGGVSLSAYPRFQLKFILQICVHHFGEVEALLGLPAGFCVSEQRPGSGGILHQGTGGTAMLVRTVMIEADETMKGIRGVLAELVEELRGNIQI
ncbi:hypothetical protein BJ875DRAFT_482931 [Amylocarpus encephaloides]|uniref:Zn(2)-C6 fungal-type domain-containing protein n=1 Tax=Amylocarpus encephaloides TaxID=45428 RepID=A0A9P7YLM7_9HELO|nr:hypothetical protein BJ875DRAFT_482931 [Amylocarpus encephaloides]